MTTVASRVVRSSPYQDSAASWKQIVDLLTQNKNEAAKKELLSIIGVASSIIAEQAPRDAAIVVTCDGTRTRIYCLYDEDSIEGSDAKEDVLGYDALKGEWAVSLPCPAEDLAWVQRSLKSKSTRITARDMSTTLGELEETVAKSEGLTLDVEKFLKS